MASLALTGASLWRAMSMRDRPAGCASCATPVRRSVRQWAAAARRPTSIVCWWRTFVGGERAMLAVPRIGAAPAPACAGDDGPPRGSVSDQHDTRRHTATSARQRGRPTRHSPPHGDID